MLKPGQRITPRPFVLPLFTEVPRRGILRTSPLRSSTEFAPNTCECHHATAGQASSEDYRKLRCLLLLDYCEWAVSVTDY